MRVVGRLLLILFAGVVASLTAGCMVTLAVLMPEMNSIELGPLEAGALGIFVGFGAIFVSSYALPPVLAVIVIAESFAIRSLLYYAVTGAVVGSLLYLGLRGGNTLPLRVDGFARREIEIMAAAGIVAGLVYWAIAGRTAGRWRKSPEPQPSVPP